MSSSIYHMPVIGDNRPQLLPDDDLCGRKMDRIETAQLESRGQCRSTIKQLSAPLSGRDVAAAGVPARGAGPASF